MYHCRPASGPTNWPARTLHWRQGRSCLGVLKLGHCPVICSDPALLQVRSGRRFHNIAAAACSTRAAGTESRCPATAAWGLRFVPARLLRPSGGSCEHRPAAAPGVQLPASKAVPRPSLSNCYPSRVGSTESRRPGGTHVDRLALGGLAGAHNPLLRRQGEFHVCRPTWKTVCSTEGGCSLAAFQQLRPGPSVTHGVIPTSTPP